MKKKLVTYNDGESMDIIVLIKDAILRKNKKNEPYLVLIFSDGDSYIRGNLWNVADDDVAKYVAGTFVQLNGIKEKFQNHYQIKILSMQTVGSSEVTNITDFTEKSYMDVNELVSELKDGILEINNPIWKSIVSFLVDKWYQKFIDFPAGKSNHHACKGGLLLHTVTMLKLAVAISKIYPQVNHSLLYAGCILHDLGKVIELSGPVATKYTVEGNLLGHLVIIDEQIILAAKELKIKEYDEDLVLLRHMVLSHHGLPEYGAARRPAILEAELLHKIDDMDATVYAITRSLQRTEPGTFTELISSQDNRRFYRPIDSSDLNKINNLE
ncbi:3'-5' exoribonuclease YhaM family protein [Lactobacillus iners]|uniref:3'-5' exoribonuclease YhaM family protein n=1 Tax=Lactobacillus iners TaxID=147802 RepID=UPI001F095D68|nr:HD domain-containing protein [Lactobacillus iners]